MRLRPLLIVLVMLGSWSSSSVADDGSFGAGTIVLESTQSVVTMESTMGGPAVAARNQALDNATAGFFEYAFLLILALGLGGLVWMRKHIHKTSSISVK